MKSFDEESHIYKFGHARLPGATDIIKSEGLVDAMWCSEDAMWRGKCVHKGIELINRNDMDWETVDESVAGYLKSYLAFLTTSGFEIAGFEEPCFDRAFACMPDIWGRMNGVPCLVELKTGAVPRWAAIQTALQARALLNDKGFAVLKRFGLRLMADGSLAKLQHFNDTRDERRAMSMLDSFYWKVENGFVKDWR